MTPWVAFGGCRLAATSHDPLKRIGCVAGSASGAESRLRIADRASSGSGNHAHDTAEGIRPKRSRVGERGQGSSAAGHPAAHVLATGLPAGARMPGAQAGG